MKKISVAFYYSITSALLFIFLLSWQPKPVNNALRNRVDAPGKKKIVFIAGACSHGKGEHEHTAGCMLLAKELNKYVSKEAEIKFYQLWPTDTTVLNDASTIVLYMDGGDAQLALRHMQHLNTLMNKGVGLVCIHYAVEVPKENGGPEFKNWLGGYFETYWSVNPIWEANYKSIPKHPVTSGVQPFVLTDEWYYHMRFKDNMEGVTPLLVAVPPASTLDRKDGAHEGNEFVRKEQGQPQVMSWATERSDGGRAFGFTGAHYHKNWGNPNFRKLVLNGIVWTAKMKVPSNGIPTPALTDDELQANLDVKPCR